MNSPERSSDLLNLLLIEDNPADAALLKRALRASSIRYELAVVQDGVEAMCYLHHEDPYRNAKNPDLILLDLNLPRKNGMEVLAEIKADPRMKIIPVIVLTGSGSTEDILRSYALGANTYLKKAASLESTSDLFNALEHFWMNLAVLPTRLNGV